MNPIIRNGIVSSTGPVILFYREVLAESGAGDIVYGAIILERVTRIPDFRPGLPSRRTILLVHIALSLEYGTVIPEYGAVILEYGTVIPEYGAVILVYGALILEYGAVIPEYGAVILEYGAIILEYGAIILEYNWNLYAKRSRNHTFPEFRVMTRTKGTDARVIRAASGQSFRNQQQK